MYPNNYDHKPSVFDLRDFLWKLLFQWKALLLFSLIIAILVPCIKYAKDSKAYSSSVASVQKALTSSETPSEQIDQLLSSLSDNDRRAVHQALWQDQQISDLCDYISESALMSIDLDSASVLEIGFRITDVQEYQDIEAIKRGYESTFDDSDSLEALKELVAPSKESKYVRELIFFNYPYETLSWNNYEYREGLISSPSEAIGVLTIYFIIPSSADEEVILETVTSLLQKKSAELSDSVAKHNIKPYHYESSAAVVSQISDRREAISEQLIFLRNNQKVFLSNLSQSQKAVYESATYLKRISNALTADPDKETITTIVGERPSFNKRYIFAGFVAGIILYSVFLFVCLKMKKVINSSAEAQFYAKSALLGEYYYDADKPGFSRLFHSKRLSKFRFRKQMELQSQADFISNRLNGSLNGVSNDLLELLVFTETDKSVESLLDAMISACGNRGISLSPVSAADFSNYKTCNHIILLITEKTHISQVESVLQVCKPGDNPFLGTVYVSEV